MLKIAGFAIFLLFGLFQPGFAQKPVITHLYMDEPSRTLRIHGHNLAGSSDSVTVNGTIAAVISRWDSMIECSMPDSGAGYAGPVIVWADGYQSRPMLLSSVNVLVSYADTVEYGSPSVHYFTNADWHLRFRIDLSADSSGVKAMTQQAPSRWSKANFAYWAYDQFGSYHGMLPKQSYGGGSIPWANPDSTTMTGFSSTVNASSTTIYFASLQIFGAHVQTTYNEPSGVQMKDEYISIYPLNTSSGQPFPTVMLDSDYRIRHNYVDRYPGNTHIYPFSGHFLIQDDSSYFLPTPLLRTAETVAATNEFALFPNPTSSQTALSIDLDKSTRVQVTLIDVLGRTMQLVCDGTFAKGKQLIRVDASKLAGGTYFLRINRFGTGMGVVKLIKLHD